MATLSRREAIEDPIRAAENRLVQQMDTLQRISSEQKRDQLGEDYFRDVREFYTMTNRAANRSPSFRPQVGVPELQLLGIQEAIEVTDIQPQIYLVKNQDTLEQDTINEAALRAQMRDCKVNLQLMLTMLATWFTGTAFMQVGFDPLRRNGRGDVTALFRDADSVFPDPYAMDDEDWQYVIIEDYLWLDQLREKWPEQAERVRANLAATGSGGAGLTSAAQRQALSLGLSVPSGPMRTMIQNLPAVATSSEPGEGRCRVRTLFTKDPRMIQVRKDGKNARLELEGVAKPEYKLRYPRGRMVTECSGVILYDDDNPYLHGQFPLVRFIGTPSLYGIWAPPPIRYTRDLQNLAERFYTQLFENAIRTNNVTWFIDESTGIDIERFGGLPGEVQMKNAHSPTPEVVSAGKLSDQAFQLPELLLALQRRLQGFPDSRQGKAPAGNTSAPSFESAISQAHILTRGRARLMKPSYQRLSFLIFATMAQYYVEPRKFVDFRAEGMGHVDWVPVPRAQLPEYMAYLDENSLNPMSAVMLRNMVPMLRNMGLLDIATALNMLMVPDRSGVLRRLREEHKQAAEDAAVKEEQKSQRRSKAKK